MNAFWNLTACGALALAGTGCGISIKGAAGHDHQSVQTSQAVLVAPPAKLPSRPAGVVDVDGRTQGSLTSAIVARGVGSGVTVGIANNGEHTGFAELCNGEVDAVDSSRPISPTEWQACAKNGIKVVQFQVAADADVIATKNEYDVGVDCLTVGQVQEIYRAGSPINNWSQVNGFDIPLRTAGPTPNNEAFGFFSRYVLGVDPPSISAFRSDYEQRPTDDGVRFAVIGNPVFARTAAFQGRALASLRALRKAIAQKNRALAAAKSQLAKDQAKNAAANFIAQDQNEITLQSQQLAQLRRSLPGALAFARQTGVAINQFNRSHGTVGIFRFSYYELWEDQLRPIEIDASTSTTTPTVHNCIFPSQETVTDGTFPLARQLLITVSAAGLRRSEVRAFLSAYLNRATALATTDRLVPLPDATITQEQGWVATPRNAPVIVYTAAQIRQARLGVITPAQTTAPATGAATGAPATTATTGTSTLNPSAPSSQTSAPTAPAQSAGY